jgi:hypothetical protein
MSCQSKEFERIATEQALASESAEKEQEMANLEGMIEKNNVSEEDSDTSQMGIIPIRPTGIYYVKRGYPVCFSREDLEKMVSYSSHKDYDAIDELILSHKCASAGGGWEWYIEEKVGGLPSFVKIWGELGPNAYPAWTVREALIKK